MYVASNMRAVSPDGETAAPSSAAKSLAPGAPSGTPNNRSGPALAIYHLTAHDRVSRSAGQSSVGSAAYIMRGKFRDERTGSTYDYRHYSGKPEWLAMFSPKDAPDWTRDAANAARFWNALELFEKRKDAQIALPLDIAMPHELTLQQNIWLAQDMIRDFTRQGYVVLAAIHPPDHDERNIHLHLLVSLRKIDANGFARTKTEQQDNYRDRDAYVNKLRDAWERHANRHLERHGIDARIDRRSLREQGITDRAPQKHRGPSAAAAVFVMQDAKGRAAALAEIEQLQAKVIDLDAKRAERQAHDAARGRRDEIKTAEKATTMQTPTDRPSNQNDQDPPPGYRVGLSVPVTFGPETIAASKAEPEPLTVETRKKMAIEREDAADPKTIQRQIDDQQDLAGRAKEQTELSERFLAGVKRAQEDGEKLREAEQSAAQRAAQDDDIADARSRYAQAAGERYDIRRPYSSLSEVVGLEGAMFQREQEKLKREAAREKDPDKRELIDLRRQIEANDYMAITSERLAAMSRIITGDRNSEELQRQQERAEYFAAEAIELRRQRQEAQERREQQREAQPTGQQHGAAAAPAAEQDNRQPETARGAVQAHEAAARASAPGQPERPISEAERPAEVLFSSPTRPLEQEAAAEMTARETTDARAVESSTAENVEITDAKAAAKARWAQHGAQVEQAIENRDRGYEHSR